jgi:hypothetical protein
MNVRGGRVKENRLPEFVCSYQKEPWSKRSKKKNIAP